MSFHPSGPTFRPGGEIQIFTSSLRYNIAATHMHPTAGGSESSYPISPIFGIVDVAQINCRRFYLETQGSGLSQTQVNQDRTPRPFNAQLSQKKPFLIWRHPAEQLNVISVHSKIRLQLVFLLQTDADVMCRLLIFGKRRLISPDLG